MALFLKRASPYREKLFEGKKGRESEGEMKLRRIKRVTQMSEGFMAVQEIVR